MYKNRIASYVIVTGILLAGIFSCKTETKQSKNETKMEANHEFLPGTFGYDLALLGKNQEVIVLKNDDGRSQVMLSTDYQGRVMTSTLDGEKGYSMGWINHDLIESGEIEEHINAFGGEDRFWLGPEGGQFSLFFRPGVSFDFDNWFTPAAFDTEPFSLITSDGMSARFERNMELLNYSGTIFNLQVNRNIRMLSRSDLEDLLGWSTPVGK